MFYSEALDNGQKYKLRFLYVHLMEWRRMCLLLFILFENQTDNQKH